MGVKQGTTAAERWYRTGVKLHDPIAAYNLGTLLSTEAHHSHDLRKAAALLRQSAAAGYVQAMHSLGLLLINHAELTISQEEAVSMLEAAAAAGSWRSSVVLGVLSRDGKEVPKDSKAAYYRFRTAILQGGEPAIRLVRNDVSILSEKLGTRQMETLDSDANVWYQQHHIVLLFVYRDGENSGRFPASALAASLNGLHANQPLATPGS